MKTLIFMNSMRCREISVFSVTVPTRDEKRQRLEERRDTYEVGFGARVERDVSGDDVGGGVGCVCVSFSLPGASTFT